MANHKTRSRHREWAKIARRAVRSRDQEIADGADKPPLSFITVFAQARSGDLKAA